MKTIKTIAFDADDTLWVNEPIFTKTQDRLKGLLEKYIEEADFDARLYATEKKNLKLFGYGIKGFMLSMIESAIELSNEQVNGSEIQKIIEMGKEMIEHPVHLLPNVEETLEQLKDDFELMIITKGDLFDQESKIARSGLAHYFDKIEIVSEKDEPTYRKVLSRHQIDLSTFLMVGNSLKSDVIPICNIGGRAVHIPFHTTWVHEAVPIHHADGVEYEEMGDMSLLPEFLSL